MRKAFKEMAKKLSKIKEVSQNIKTQQLTSQK